MRLVIAKITEWDESQMFAIPEELKDNIKKEDLLIVKSGDEFEDAAIAVKILGEEKENSSDNFVLRKAAPEDIDKIAKIKDKKAEYLKYCYECAKNLGLEMKLVDAHISFDEQRIVFAFTAEGRIDFRELVKMLNWSFRKSIRMHQIGIRDEAKIAGNLGVCGRELCCRKFLKDLASVSSDAADAQQLAHRGAERISGICGRLMCCLNYEKEGYCELAKNIPPIGSFVKFEGRELKVVGRHILKQTVILEIDKDTKIEAEIGKLGYKNF